MHISHILELNAEGLVCPEPIMLLHQTVRELRHGTLVLMRATDPSTRRDVQYFCHFLGHQLLKQEEKNGILLYTVRKREKSG